MQSNTHTSSLNQHLSYPVWLVLQKCNSSSMLPPQGVLQLCGKIHGSSNLPQLLQLHTGTEEGELTPGKGGQQTPS